MPNTKSAIKALRQSKKRAVRNLAKKKALKNIIRKIRKTKDKTLLPLVYKRLDKAAKANLIKKNKASRLKSRLSQSINKSSKAIS